MTMTMKLVYLDTRKTTLLAKLLMCNTLVTNNNYVTNYVT